MTPVDLSRLLMMFAVVSVGLGVMMMVVFRDVALGAGQAAMGGALVAVAIASGKKKNG